MSTGDTANFCSQANEAKPERSINSFQGGEGPAEYFVAYQHINLGDPRSENYNNWTSPSLAWTSDFHETPEGPGIYATNDSWSATHGGTGLEYAVAIGTPISGMPQNTWCVAAAATDRAGLAGEAWLDTGYRCIEEFDSGIRTDGPVIVADWGAPTLYVAYARLAGANAARLLRLHECTGGVPGSPSCPVDWPADTAPGNIGHANAAVNPCTHHPILLYRTTTTISAQICDLDGNLLNAGNELLVSGAPFDDNTNCGGAACSAGEICKCGGSGNDCTQPGPGTCLDLAPRPRAVTRFDPDSETCSLYLAFDSSSQASDGETYMKSHLRVFDITNELTPQLVTSIDSADDSAIHNDFNAVVSADYFTDAVGLFFYRQDGGDPCTTTYRGIVSTDGVTFADLNTQISGPFPSVRFHFTNGLGHYTGATAMTKPGRLYPTWGEPVGAGVPCVSCQNVDYGLRVMGAGVRP